MFELRYFNTLELYLFKSGEANSLTWKMLPYYYYITIQMMLEYSSQHKIMSSILCTNSVVHEEFS